MSEINNGGMADAQQPDYAALEREHYGDPDKRTGIYAERAADVPQVGADGEAARRFVIEKFTPDVQRDYPALTSPAKMGGDEREVAKQWLALKGWQYGNDAFENFYAGWQARGALSAEMLDTLLDEYAAIAANGKAK